MLWFIPPPRSSPTNSQSKMLCEIPVSVSNTVLCSVGMCIHFGAKLTHRQCYNKKKTNLGADKTRVVAGVVVVTSRYRSHTNKTSVIKSRMTSPQINKTVCFISFVVVHLESSVCLGNRLIYIYICIYACILEKTIALLNSFEMSCTLPASYVLKSRSGFFFACNFAFI